eukprot:UN10091
MMFFVLFLSQLVVGITDPFLANWQENLIKFVENRTLSDLYILGTHDSLTYDLSLTIADGAVDDHPFISKVLHYISGVTPKHWIRSQGQTQGLTITEQLENGIRFIDFRNMYSADEWYT